MSEESIEEKLSLNAETIESSYVGFYLRSTKLESYTLFHVMAKCREDAMRPDHLLIETKNRHVAYFTLEALKLTKTLTELIIKTRRNL